MLMNKRIKSLNLIFLCLLIVFCFGGCDLFPKKESPEERLLKVFEFEVRLLDRYSENYLAYMAYQIENFSSKNKLTTRLIDEINAQYDTMSDDEKRGYQLEWYNKFQPVIDTVYEKTRLMIVNQTKHLDPGIMSKIQELTVKMEMLEKQHPAAKLKPKFFMTPLEDE